MWVNGTWLSVLSRCKLSNAHPYQLHFRPKLNLVVCENNVRNNSLPQLAGIFTPCTWPSNYRQTIHVVNFLPIHTSIIKFEERYAMPISQLHPSSSLRIYRLKFVRIVWRQRTQDKNFKRECGLRATMSYTDVNEQKKSAKLRAI